MVTTRNRAPTGTGHLVCHGGEGNAEDVLVAVCHQPEMATQGGTLEELIAMIRDLARCRFEDGDERLHWPVRLRFKQDSVLAALPAS